MSSCDVGVLNIEKFFSAIIFVYARFSYVYRPFIVFVFIVRRFKTFMILVGIIGPVPGLFVLLPQLFLIFRGLVLKLLAIGVTLLIVRNSFFVFVKWPGCWVLRTFPISILFTIRFFTKVIRTRAHDWTFFLRIFSAFSFPRPSVMTSRRRPFIGFRKRWPYIVWTIFAVVFQVFGSCFRSKVISWTSSTRIVIVTLLSPITPISVAPWYWVRRMFGDFPRHRAWLYTSWCKRIFEALTFGRSLWFSAFLSLLSGGAVIRTALVRVSVIRVFTIITFSVVSTTMPTSSASGPSWLIFIWLIKGCSWPVWAFIYSAAVLGSRPWPWVSMATSTVAVASMTSWPLAEFWHR